MTILVISGMVECASDMPPTFFLFLYDQEKWGLEEDGHVTGNRRFYTVP